MVPTQIIVHCETISIINQKENMSHFTEIKTQIKDIEPCAWPVRRWASACCKTKRLAGIMRTKPRAISVANPCINWRAFSLAFFFILFVSLCWEATIAVPCQWWGFQPRQMIGLTINGFSGLPVEEPILWVGITWPTVLVYETIYTLRYRAHRQLPRNPAVPDDETNR